LLLAITIIGVLIVIAGAPSVGMFVTKLRIEPENLHTLWLTMVALGGTFVGGALGSGNGGRILRHGKHKNADESFHCALHFVHSDQSSRVYEVWTDRTGCQHEQLFLNEQRDPVLATAQQAEGDKVLIPLGKPSPAARFQRALFNPRDDLFSTRRHFDRS